MIETAGETYWREEAERWKSIAKGWERELSRNLGDSTVSVIWDTHTQQVYGVYADEDLAWEAWKTTPGSCLSPSDPVPVYSGFRRKEEWY